MVRVGAPLPRLKASFLGRPCLWRALVHDLTERREIRLANA